MACGVAAGFLFARASRGAALLAGLLYFLGNVLDCADGQLARLQSSDSPVGYLVDGAADYVGTFAVFVGMAHSLNLLRPAVVNWWWLVVAAGASMAWQCAFLDRKRREWQRRAGQIPRDRKEGIAALARQAEQWRIQGTHLLGRALIASYRVYRIVWAPLTETRTETQMANDHRWADCHRPVLRRSVWVGPTMHVTAIVLCAGVLNRPEAYLWAAISIGNLWMLATFAAERRASRCAGESQ
jgi:hypothetical protein